MSLDVGTVRVGRDGRKYTYVGGEEKSRDSWKEVKAEPEKSGFGSKVLAGLETANEGAKFLNKLNPLAFAGSKVAEAVSPENAYDIGGKVTDVTGSPELGFAANVTTQAIPSILSGNIVKSASESILKPAGRFVMQAAVKPSKAAHLSGDAAKAIETVLKEGVNVTPGGMAKLSKEVGALSKQVDDIINAAEQSGAQVSTISALKPWQAKLKEASAQINSKSDISATKEVLREFLEDPRVRDAISIPIKTAQEMKTATYKALGSKAYGELGSANIEAQKSIVSGLRGGIEQAAPGVAPLNKRMSELLNAIEVVEPRALSAGNANLAGLAPLAENPWAAGGFMLDRSELIKSILGRFLYSGAPSVLGNTAKGATAIGLGAAQED